MADLAAATASYYPTAGFTIMAASLWQALVRCAPAAARAWREGFAQAMEEFAPSPARPLVGDVHLFTRRVLNIEAKGKPGRRLHMDDTALGVYGICRHFYIAVKPLWDRKTRSYKPHGKQGMDAVKGPIEEAWNNTRKPTFLLPPGVSRTRPFPKDKFEKGSAFTDLAGLNPKELALALAVERCAFTLNTVEKYYKRGERLVRPIKVALRAGGHGPEVSTDLWTPSSS